MANLDEWNRRFLSPEIFNPIHSYYFFSPEWEDVVRPLQESYEKLEAERQAIGEPRREWQANAESMLASFTQERANVSHMNDRLWPMCPLWAQLAKYKNRPDNDPQRRLYGWNSMLNDWQEINSLFEDDEEFRESLSQPQWRSYHLLSSWWKATYCDKRLFDGTIEYFASMRRQKTTFSPAGEQRLVGTAKYTRADTSVYHANLLRLFLLELHPQSWNSYASHPLLVRLQEVRYWSAILTTTQKLASAALHTGEGNDDAREEPYPDLVLNEPRHETATNLDKPPYYLWDTEENRTVVVSSLDDRPEYVCISHTWGRWRTPASHNISGVPWLVPGNSVFDVRRIPAQLPGLRSRYIWLDLFCIPQFDKNAVTKDEVAEKISKEEIENQAAIFKGSSRCIGWINDIESWTGVNSALNWISFRALELTCTRDVPAIRKVMSKATKAATAAATMELMKRGEPATWFSSLWTLQECVLCPNIELYSRTWEPLLDARGTPIPLRPLVAFLYETETLVAAGVPISMSLADPVSFFYMRGGRKKDGSSANRARLPGAVQEIYSFRRLTRLDNALTTGSPAAVLVNSNLRQASSSRAPAIMSAINVTDWYDPKRPRGQLAPGDMLVFNMYPLSFLREAARKLGAIFYESATGTGRSAGSLLPLSPDNGWKCSIPGVRDNTLLDREDHNAVAGWVINGDGSVDISRAGIVMTSTDAERAPGRVKVYGAVNHPSESLEKGGTDDVLLRIKRYARAGPVYAVALYRDTGLLFGVLLEAVSTVQGRQHLVRTATFHMMNVPMPASTSVQWKVL